MNSVAAACIFSFNASASVTCGVVSDCWPNNLCPSALEANDDGSFCTASPEFNSAVGLNVPNDRGSNPNDGAEPVNDGGVKPVNDGGTVEEPFSSGSRSSLSDSESMSDSLLFCTFVIFGNIGMSVLCVMP